MKTLCVKSFLLIALLWSVNIYGQSSKRVLFLGNSYTGANNLPQLISQVAFSAGETLVYDSHAPGGYYIGSHLLDATSLGKINTGDWDNVVLQDQSLALAYPSTFMYGLQYPIKLDSLMKLSSPCAQIIFFSTWGRKNGDQYICNPPECPQTTVIVRNYYEMDSTIESHYKIYADSIKSSMSPVGAVWRYIRQNYPSIDLFQQDESHPSLAGSYAAACCFYTTIFREDPTNITFNSSLSSLVADNIRSAVKEIVFEDLNKWNIGTYDSLLGSNCAPLEIERYETLEFDIYPNPAKDILHIVANNQNKLNNVLLFDLSGQIIQEIEFSIGTEINLSKFRPGLYILKSNDGNQYFKIIKN